jgi:arsenical pump membrane protein
MVMAPHPGAIAAAGWTIWTTWAIFTVSTARVLIRPRHWSEAMWAVAGAALILALGLLPAGDAWQAIGKGGDVCLFLIEMMLLSEIGREAGSGPPASRI